MSAARDLAEAAAATLDQAEADTARDDVATTRVSLELARAQAVAAIALQLAEADA